MAAQEEREHWRVFKEEEATCQTHPLCKKIPRPAFAREGLIQNPDEVKAKYAIVLVQRNWLGQKIASILGLSDKKGEASFKVVKLI